MPSGHRRPSPLLAVLLLLAATSSPAQETVPDPPPNGAAPTEPVTPNLTPWDGAREALTLELARKRVDELVPVPDGPAEAQAARAEARGLWGQVVTQLGQAEEHRQAAASFEEARLGAPERLASIRSSLADAKPVALPAPPPAADLGQLEQSLAAAQAEVAAAEKAVADLEAERKNRATRRVEIPKSLATLRQRLAELPEITPTTTEPGSLAEARRAHAIATRRVVEAEIDRAEKELSSYEARGELLAARQDQAARRLADAKAVAQAWNDHIAERRRREAESARLQAERTSAAAERTQAHRVVRELAEANAELATRRGELATAIEALDAEFTGVRADLERVLDRRRSVLEKVELAGFTNAIALLMQRHRGELAALRDHRRAITQRQRTIVEATIESAELEEQREDLGSLDAAVARRMSEVEADVPAEERARIEERVRSLLTSRRELLDTLIGDATARVIRLVDLDTTERQLVTVAEDYAFYIDEHILWVRSADPVSEAVLPALGEALSWLLSPSAWVEAGRAAISGAGRSPASTASGLLAVLVLLLLQPRRRQRMRDVAAQLAKRRIAPMAPTFECVGWTIVGAAVAPLTISLAGRGLTSWTTGSLGQSLGTALIEIAVVVAPITLLDRFCRPSGLGPAHFRWEPAASRSIRRRLWIARGVLVPALFVALLADAQDEPSYKASLGRLAFAVAMVALVFLTRDLLRPGAGLVARAQARASEDTVRRVQRVWYLVALALPAGLLLASVLGFHYAALQLALRLLQTWLLALGLTIVRGVAVRGLAMGKRRLLRDQAIKRREAQKEAQKVEIVREGEAAVEDEVVDVSLLDAQARQLVGGALGIVLLVGLWLIWADVLPAFGALDSIVVWGDASAVAADGPASPVFPMPGEDAAGGGAGGGATPAEARDGEPARAVTLAALLLALVVVALTLLFARNLPALLEITVLRHMDLEHGTSYAITTVSRYFITTVGLVIAFGLVGVTWRSVQWMAAAITVGLGFGLQEIFGNFVSGLIILFERPIRIGDIVTVADINGVVTRIRIRATTIRDWDRRELLVPNKEFVTSRLINWTLTDPVTRVVFPVGIAYGSDTARATEALMEAARSTPLVLGKPEPSVVFRNFGESSLNFDLRIFIASRDHWPDVTHDVNRAIDETFKAHGIRIPFPQRDVHVYTTDGRVETKTVPGTVAETDESADTDRRGTTGT